jgi:hypothetical protein
MAGDASLAVLRGWLRRRGSRAASAGMRLNVDCAERAVGRLEGHVRSITAVETTSKAVYRRTPDGAVDPAVGLILSLRD